MKKSDYSDHTRDGGGLHDAVDGALRTMMQGWIRRSTEPSAFGELNLHLLAGVARGQHACERLK